MQNRYLIWLLVLIVTLIPIGWLAWPTNTEINFNLPFGDTAIQRDISVRQGLDLQGGLQVLLEADLPADQPIEREAMETARLIVENRVNSLGVAEPVVQLAGDRRIVVELPGVEDTEQALTLLRQTGLLEFVDTGSVSPPAGTLIQTDFAQSGTTTPAPSPTPAGAATDGATAVPTSEATLESTTAATAEGTTQATTTATAAPTAEPTAAGPVYHTIMTGSALRSASVQLNEQTGQYYVAFTLTPEGSQIFGDFTATNQGQYLTIVLDKRVISSPVIQAEIRDQGVIEGSFTNDEANSLAINLRYGSLPVPLRMAESRVIGPTLGQDSLNRSLIAGAIGLACVMVFMLLYYRLPGLTANLAIVAYAIIALAVFKLVPVTLTLAGVAGFMLSTGSALDANILIFERMKEELRSGKRLGLAVQEGFRRALSSIFDSNVATLIICAILWWFASSFGATIVRGFAVTLAIGVIISLFCALVVTRLLLYVVVEVLKPSDHGRWFGI